jgi:hypothetical protein
MFRSRPLPGPRSTRQGKRTLPDFLEGANLPWLRYGGDFGANAWVPNGGVGQVGFGGALRRHFHELKERGLHAVRWFLLCDGRAGIRFTAAGTPTGPDPLLFRDIDAALDAAAAAGLKIIFVLLDFLWFGEAAWVSGVQVRGRGRTVTGAYKQRALRRRVIRPILRRYGRSPFILAWDIVNEPEWVTRGCGKGLSGGAVPFLTMRRFIRKTVRLVHRYTCQLATVGLGNAAGLPLVREIGLDFYQVHWYDRWESLAPLERPVSELGLDRPLLLGEFPTRNSSRSPDSIVAAARSSGYCGALGWSVLGSDRASGIDLDSEKPAG